MSDSEQLVIYQLHIFILGISPMIWRSYRHGLRVAEVASLRWEQIDWNGGTIYVKRVKKGTPSVQPLSGLEIRSLRHLQRDYPASCNDLQY
jgi:integrase